MNELSTNWAREKWVAAEIIVKIVGWYILAISILNRQHLDFGCLKIIY